MNDTMLLDGLLSLGTVAIFVSFIVAQVQRLKWLHGHGRRIIALVTRVRHETGKNRLGLASNNYYLTARWTDPRSGKTTIFDTWTTDRPPAYREGDLIPVLIDPCHPERYEVEI